MQLSRARARTHNAIDNSHGYAMTCRRDSYDTQSTVCCSSQLDVVANAIDVRNRYEIVVT